LPSRRSVLICLGAALAGGLGTGAAVGAAGAAPGWIPGLRRLAGSALPKAYHWATITIPAESSATLGGDVVRVRVPQGWKETLRGSQDGVFRDYIAPNETWLRVRIFLASGGESLSPRNVASENLDGLLHRATGLPGYQQIDEEFLGVQTSDAPQRDKPCYQLRYSFLLDKRRRYVLERYFDEGDLVYLVGAYSWSEDLDDIDPIVTTTIGSLRRDDG
jgi:hypothetical protein